MPLSSFSLYLFFAVLLAIIFLVLLLYYLQGASLLCFACFYSLLLLFLFAIYPNIITFNANCNGSHISYSRPLGFIRKRCKKEPTAQIAHLVFCQRTGKPKKNQKSYFFCHRST